MTLPEHARREIEMLAARYPERRAALLPALRVVERECGAVTEPGMLEVAGLLGVPPAHVFGVFTFYTHYRRATDGTFVLQVCSTLPCALRGSERIFDRIAERLGLRNGQTTRDGRFTLKKVECLADCDRAPLLQCNDDYLEFLTPERIDELIGQLERGSPAFAPEGASAGRPAFARVRAEVSRTRHEPVVLKYVEHPDSHTIGFYESHGGYRQAERVVRSVAPKEIIETVKASGLRGKGGAGFSTGMKWGFIAPDSPNKRYLICNADESEPGTFKDKMILEEDPHAVLEGIIIAAKAIGARDAYVYIRGEFSHGARVVQGAIDEATRKGYLGKKIFGTDYDLEVTVHRGAGAYICGEETGLITSLEGERGYPKIKPPFPAVEGFFRCPTIVNNVETLASVPAIFEKGVDWHRSAGTKECPGWKIFCLCGHVARPGLYEVPLGTPLRELIYELGGGIADGRSLKAVIPGGISAAVLTPDEIDVAMDFEALKKAGTMLGSGGVIVMDDRTCMVDAVWNTLRFFHHESCGQCTPCREGTGWLEKMLERIERGGGRPSDLARIDEICDAMVGRTICVLADAAAMPTQSILKKYRSEFEQHIRERGCPLRRAEAPAHARV
jgi:NADH-quinone oxidoreductase subunit F